MKYYTICNIKNVFLSVTFLGLSGNRLSVLPSKLYVGSKYRQLGLVGEWKNEDFNCR